ncbi:peptidase inhibitor family I36 protein [Cellulomonas sp. JH27-2]|uniref:peptidase inhibitor family I36 protein n=1 Tax=Cellulomonas sp. JH27-2 TaxID=2774139 RepID=UPI00177B9A34|nr:peptidase inhibitor family I36 protein [Cellulomonas sp. JH27-2]MBD8059300.1 peptidase inhibitor family I36 protein [Cellulomonas sp. JH27-2]
MGRIARAAAALTLCVAGAALAPAAVADDVDLVPASAGQCEAGQFCVWSSAGYVGTFQSVGSTTVKATAMPVARSVWNRSGKAAAVYSGLSGSGAATCYAPGTQISATSVAAASFRLLSTSSC